MKPRLKPPSPAVIISLIALFVALGGTAYASGLISGSQIKNHSIAEKKLTSKAIRSLHGQRGPKGLTGAPGPAGAAGAPGSPGVVSVGWFAGPIGVIHAGSWLWAGPVTTLTTTASQSIVASGSSVLGTTGPTVTAWITVCATTHGAVPIPFNSKWVEVDVTSTRLTYAASATVAEVAGTWDVGMCVWNQDFANPLDNNDWSEGYAFVVNGKPVS